MQLEASCSTLRQMESCAPLYRPNLASAGSCRMQNSVTRQSQTVRCSFRRAPGCQATTSRHSDSERPQPACSSTEGVANPPSTTAAPTLNGWLPLICSSPALLSLLALPAQAADVPQLAEGGFSKSSYYVTLGLFLLSVPGEHKHYASPKARHLHADSILHDAQCRLGHAIT